MYLTRVQPGTTEDYTNTIDVVATWVISDGWVNAVDTTKILVARDYDLALVKTVSWNDTVFSRGDIITYVITVRNQWDIDANNIQVTDYIPTWFTLEDSAWSLNGSRATRTISSIPAGSSQTVNIQLRVGNNVTGSVINWAEISSDDGDDIDSTPDSNNNNDCHGGLGRDSVDPTSDDRTNADLDGNVWGNDRQTVEPGERAVFRIRVTNTGTDDLNNIVLTDDIAPNCAGSITLPNTFPNTWSNPVVAGSGNNSDAVLQPGEYVEYTCTRANTTENYTNIADVNADSVVTRNPVPEVSDPTQVLVELPYDLALTKKVKSNNGTDFASGDIVTYDIRVINQGAIDANNIVITDYIPSALELADDAWTLSGTNATRNVGMVRAGEAKTFSINLRVRDNAPDGAVINWAEISSDDGDDVDSTPDTNNNNDCHGGLGRNEVDPNSDDRTNGTGDANGNGRYIPAGLELADTNWTASGNNAVRTIASLSAGRSVTLGLNLRVSADATAGNTINWAEISSDNGDDVDSTPDTNNNNDCHGTAPSDRSAVDANADDRINGTGDANGNGRCDAGEITVTNQGTVDATNIVVTDYVPAGMTVAGEMSLLSLQDNLQLLPLQYLL